MRNLRLWLLNPTFPVMPSLSFNRLSSALSTLTISKPMCPSLPPALVQKQTVGLTKATIDSVQQKLAQVKAECGGDTPWPLLPWTPRSKRCGAVGQKLGMMTIWDHWGVQHGATVIKVSALLVAGRDVTLFFSHVRFSCFFHGLLQPHSLNTHASHSLSLLCWHC